MTERLTIRNFAGLDDIDIELGRINIFIGPQASGKSICVKCLYFFKGFINQLLAWAVQPDNSYSLDELNKQRFNSLFDLNDNTGHFTVNYQFGDFFITVQGEGASVHITYASYYETLFIQARKALEQSESHDPTIASLLDLSIQQRFQKEAADKMGALSSGTQIFVPASRALYSLMPPTASLGGQFSTDAFLSEFGRFYQYMRRDFPFFHELQSQRVKELSGRILRAKLSLKKNQDEYLIQDNGHRVRLINASSGQQEVIPLVLALEYLAWSSKREIIGYIEEPEAHLHPEGQRDIVNLMAAVYNQREAPLQLLLTTHTPYLLSSFNNLIYAGQLDKQLEDNDIIGRKKLYATVPKELHMQLADFRVYGIENGKATSLIDEEFGLLMAQSLDSVSDIIADQFGALMDLDPANKSSPAEQ